MNQSPYAKRASVSRGEVNAALFPLLTAIGVDFRAVYSNRPVVITNDYIDVHVVATGDEVEAGEGLVEVGDDEFAEWGRVVRVEIDNDDWGSWRMPDLNAPYPEATGTR